MTTNMRKQTVADDASPVQYQRRTGCRTTLLTFLLLAGFATMVTPEISSAQTAPAKRVVRCVGSYNTGYTRQIMTCSSSLGSFTAVPSGQYLSITNVLITPYSSASTAVTGIELQK